MSVREDGRALAVHYRQADRLMAGVLVLHLVYCLGIALILGTSVAQALLYGLILLAVSGGLIAVQPGQRATRITVAVAFMGYSALAIHLAEGMIEMHFGIFALLALLLYYRDWAVIAAGAAATALHHVLGHILQHAGSPLYVFPQGEHGWGLVFLHAGYVVFQASLLIHMARILHRDAAQAAELGEVGEHLAAEGDRVDLTWRHPSARGRVTQGIHAFLDKVHAGVVSARKAADAVMDTVAQLRGELDENRQRVRRQQEDTDEIAGAMQQMAATTQEVARNAATAAESARQAEQATGSGRTELDRAQERINTLARAVEQASAVVERLNGESERIGTVVDVIRSVSEQTNLLALNAAIESARAGEHGRGFSVVAEEVRLLAQRTRESTEEIGGMIDRLREEANGVYQVITAGNASSAEAVQAVQAVDERLQDIERSVQAINQMNDQIASASEEQTSATEEINRRLASVRHSSADSSRVAETTTEACEQLERRARHLAESVDTFRI
ncbi:MAG: methyl-accepting chemotaxis protein [Ectothiorhodospiraceae bacterium]|nr:methyl-accepting chemotaxis protein [Ectothiorhodospiraceae bacterium]